MRAAGACGGCTSESTMSITTPTRMAFAMVPTPSRCGRARHPISDEHADDDRPRADREAERPREPLVEHIPRVETEPGEHEHRGRDAVQNEPDEQLDGTAQVPVRRDRGDDSLKRAR